MDELRAGVLRLIEVMTARSKANQIDHYKWRAVLGKATRRAPEDVASPTEREGWYILFGFRSQNAAKYLGRNPTRPIGQTHIDAIHATLIALGVTKSPQAPQRMPDWIKWVNEQCLPSEDLRPDPIILAALKASPIGRSLLQNLSTHGVVVIIGSSETDRFNEAEKAINHGIDGIVALITFDQSLEMPNPPVERDLAEMCKHVIGRVAQVLCSQPAPDYKTFKRAYDEFYRQWRNTIETRRSLKRDLSSPKRNLFIGLSERLSWTRFCQVLAQNWGDIDRVDLLCALADVLRVGGHGVAVVLHNAFSLDSCSDFIRSLFFRNESNPNGPLLVVTSREACLHLDAFEAVVFLPDSKRPVASGHAPSEVTSSSNNSPPHVLRTVQGSTRSEIDWNPYVGSDLLEHPWLPERLVGFWSVYVLVEDKYVEVSVVQVLARERARGRDEEVVPFAWHRDRSQRPLWGEMRGRGPVLWLLTEDNKTIMRWEIGDFRRGDIFAPVKGHYRSDFEVSSVEAMTQQSAEMIQDIRAQLWKPSPHGPLSIKDFLLRIGSWELQEIQQPHKHPDIRF
jgi:hypothetical protein